MRRFTSVLVASALFLGMMPGVTLASTSAAQSSMASVANAGTQAELIAALADPAVTAIELSANIDTTAQITVDRPVTIDGAGFTVKVTSDLRPLGNGYKHALAFVGHAVTPFVVKNLTVDSNSLAYGVNTYGNAVVQLENMTLKNSWGAGLTVNGSNVTATGLTTSGNRWGAVNADPGSGVLTPTVFTLLSGTLSEVNKIWSDGANVTPVATVEVDASSAGFESIPTGIGLSIWTVPRTVNVADAPGLIAAIRDLQAGDTINLAAGTYDVERQLGDMTFGGQTGWYLPLWRPGVTVKGAGSGETTITSSVESVNGAWASQDFFSVWANNVTIEGMTIVPKKDTNKAIEIMGKDFTLRDVKVITNPTGPEIGSEFYEFGGSVYFNPQASVAGVAGNVGDSRLEGVFIESAWISASSSVVTSGTIALRDVTIDWVGAGYAPYAGYGVMSANPRIVAEANVLVIADNTFADFVGQVSNRIPAGATLQTVGFTDAVGPSIFSGLMRNGSYPAGGALTFSAEGLAPSGEPLYSWTFPVGTLDPSFSATFTPGVAKTVSLNAPLRNGRALLKVDFAQRGAMPGPASLKLYVGQGFAGMKLVDAFLGAAAVECTVDSDGFITIGVDSSDTMYLVECRENTVRFNSGGGTTVASQAVFDGMLAVGPTVVPAKLGYSFVGWFTDLGLTRAWGFTTDVVTGDTTLYAKYKALPKAVLGNPVAPRWISHSRYYTVYGSLRPQHTAGTYPVRIYKYRYVNGAWKSYGYVLAKASNDGAYSKYSRSIRLPYAGKWRLRAYAPADSGHSGTWSTGYDYVSAL